MYAILAPLSYLSSTQTKKNKDTFPQSSHVSLFASKILDVSRFATGIVLVLC
jgi:hypothetical protein